MNAKEQFKIVTQARGWHGITGDIKAQNAANYDKHLALAGKLSYDKCAQWLERLGYKKYHDEVWMKQSDIGKLITTIDAGPMIIKQSIWDDHSGINTNPEKLNKLSRSHDNTPNGTQDDRKLGILHSVCGYYVSNEGTKDKPNYHVCIPGITNATCDSAYEHLDLAVCRCNYLARAATK